MINPREREKKVFESIDRGDWNSAIDHASHVPKNWDIWQRLPSAAPMPDHAINKVLDVLTHTYGHHKENFPSFAYELTNNLPETASTDTLNRIGRALIHHNPKSFIEQQNLAQHPNFKRDEEGEALKRATDFWHSYEKSVMPHHFATIKSMFTGSPEEMKDHRGNAGSSSTHMHLIPDLRSHAKKVQELIMKDDDIVKQNFKGEPHIQVHRGVNGHYGKLIRDRANYNPSTKEVDKKTFHIPTAHLTSWTVDPEMGSRFAIGRGNIENQPKDQGVVLSQWVPVKSILHSGFHQTVVGQAQAHPYESEIVIGHPEGKFKISTKEMKFQDPDTQDDVESAKFRKSENDSDIIDLTISSAYLPDSDFGVQLSKNMFKNKIVPAATALALLGAPQDTQHTMPVGHMPSIVQQQTQPEPVQNIQRDTASLYSGLMPIKMIESSGGRNTNHAQVDHGLNAGTKAYGKFGLMPLTITETVKRSPALSAKYPNLLNLHHKKDHDTIHKLMAEEPQAEIDIANTHWDRLRGIFGNNKDKMAYAWYNGITGALRASDEDIKDHDYVKKYQKYRKMSDLEKKLVKKSAQLDPNAIGIEKFLPLTEAYKNQKDIKDINAAISSNQLHNLSSVGKFTHDSFVAGFNADNSWLLKLEPMGVRSSIDSAKYGLQVIKEAAFYYAANKIFNLGMYTPKAVLGEVVKDGKNWPSVAIKMYPQVFVSGHDMEESKPNSMKSILEKYRRTGELHKMAAMLYILGDADAHGNNVLTDGSTVKLIDHGTSFASEGFNPSKDEDIFVPYILRMWGYKDSMSPEDKMTHMPKIDDGKIKNELKHWVHNLSGHDLIEILSKFYIDPKPSLFRLKMLQKMVGHIDPDTAINYLWINGNGEK